jgi:hypothetical protein
MQPNEKISETLAVLGVVSPVSQGAGAVSTAWVSAAQYLRLMAFIQTGVMGASATLDAKIQQASDTSGTGVKDVTGKAVVQILKAAGDNVQALINFRPDDLDQVNGFTCVRLTLTVATAASLVSAVLLGVPRFAPASDFSPAGVVQNVG